MNVGLWPKHAANLGANSMGKPDTSTAQTENVLLRSKINILFSKFKKICTKYDQIRDTNKDVKTNELVFQIQILQGIKFSYRIN